jgi:hypothetical protein
VGLLFPSQVVCGATDVDSDFSHCNSQMPSMYIYIHIRIHIHMYISLTPSQTRIFRFGS